MVFCNAIIMICLLFSDGVCDVGDLASAGGYDHDDQDQHGVAHPHWQPTVFRGVHEL